MFGYVVVVEYVGASILRIMGRGGKTHRGVSAVTNCWGVILAIYEAGKPPIQWILLSKGWGGRWCIMNIVCGYLLAGVWRLVQC